MKEAQDRDKKRIEAYYSDIEKMSKDTLKQLEEQYSKNWNAIADSISLTVTKTTKQLNDLKLLQANFTATEVDNAINSGNISDYLNKNQDKLNNKAVVDMSDIDNHLKSINLSADNASGSIDGLTDSYNKLLSIKKDTDITDADVTDRKQKVSKIVKVDSDGQYMQVTNTKDTNLKLETEQDSHYNKELARQNKAQTDEYNSAVQFADKFVKFEDKFLELVQMVWDFRFGNIVNISESATGYILEALTIGTEAYEKFKAICDNMGIKIGDIDLSDVQAKFDTYKKDVVTWADSKKSLYDNSNNPLYNKDVYDKYKAYANASGYSMDSTVLNSLAGSGLASTINNNKTSTNKTDVTIKNVEVKSDNAQNLISQLITIAEQVTKTN